jgi:hypothetical protein
MARAKGAHKNHRSINSYYESEEKQGFVSSGYKTVLLLIVSERHRMSTLLNMPGQNVAVHNVTFPKRKRHITSNVPKHICHKTFQHVKVTNQKTLNLKAIKNLKNVKHRKYFNHGRVRRYIGKG